MNKDRIRTLLAISFLISALLWLSIQQIMLVLYKEVLLYEYNSFISIAELVLIIGILTLAVERWIKLIRRK